MFQHVSPVPTIDHRMTRPFFRHLETLAPLPLANRPRTQGTYGTVFRGTLRDGTEVAIKVPTIPGGFKKSGYPPWN